MSRKRKYKLKAPECLETLVDNVVDLVFWSQSGPRGAFGAMGHSMKRGLLRNELTAYGTFHEAWAGELPSLLHLFAAGGHIYCDTTRNRSNYGNGASLVVTDETFHEYWAVASGRILLAQGIDEKGLKLNDPTGNANSQLSEVEITDSNGNSYSKYLSRISANMLADLLGVSETSGVIGKAIRRHWKHIDREQGGVLSNRPDAQPGSVKTNQEKVSYPANTLWYRQHPFNGDLVFASPGSALYVDEIRSALASETWGEFRRLMPEAEFDVLFYGEHADMWELEPVPQDDDPFNSDIYPGYAEGDYPEWLQQGMENTLPKDIVDKYGSFKTTVFNGDYLSISPEHEDEIVDTLRNQGFVVERRGDLSFW